MPIKEQPVLEQPICMFKTHGPRSLNEYWIFDIRNEDIFPDQERVEHRHDMIKDYEERKNTAKYVWIPWVVSHRFHSFKKMRNNKWRLLNAHRTLRHSQSFLMIRAGAIEETHPEWRIERLFEMAGAQLTYTPPPATPKAAFLDLIDRANQATTTNQRLLIIQEINEILPLLAMLEQVRGNLEAKERKRLGV